MRINTNVSALNAQRQLGNTNNSVAKQIGRLSSGYRINRAGDDAAGLGIANKLRADTRSLEQAARNAEQAGSVLQVAEGATQTVQNIVERMKELATQSASDSVSDDGRAKIQDEFKALQDEITRIVDTTEFQGKNLLNGGFGNTVNSSSNGLAVVAAADGDGDTDATETVFSAVSIDGASSGSYAVTGDTTASSESLTLTNSEGIAQTVDISGASAGDTLSFDQFGINLTLGEDFTVADAGEFAADGSDVVTVTDGNAAFMVSSSGDYAGQDQIELDNIDLSLDTMGIDVDTVNLSSRANAESALTAIDGALSNVSDVFGTIGAAQNRIEYATQNVKTSIENFAAAESTIRDADMAKEMTELSRQQILQQAGTAMLAQANQAPQGVLQLLR